MVSLAELISKATSSQSYRSLKIPNSMADPHTAEFVIFSTYRAGGVPKTAVVCFAGEALTAAAQMARCASAPPPSLAPPHRSSYRKPLSCHSQRYTKYRETDR